MERWPAERIGACSGRWRAPAPAPAAVVAVAAAEAEAVAVAERLPAQLRAAQPLLLAPSHRRRWRQPVGLCLPLGPIVAPDRVVWGTHRVCADDLRQHALATVGTVEDHVIGLEDSQGAAGAAAVLARREPLQQLWQSGNASSVANFCPLIGAALVGVSFVDRCLPPLPGLPPRRKTPARNSGSSLRGSRAQERIRRGQRGSSSSGRPHLRLFRRLLRRLLDRSPLLLLSPKLLHGLNFAFSPPSAGRSVRRSRWPPLPPPPPAAPRAPPPPPWLLPPPAPPPRACRRLLLRRRHLVLLRRMALLDAGELRLLLSSSSTHRFDL